MGFRWRSTGCERANRGSLGKVFVRVQDASSMDRNRRIESIRPGSTATVVCYRRTLRRRCQAVRPWPGAIPIAEVSPCATITCDFFSRLGVDASARCWRPFSCGTVSPVSSVRCISGATLEAICLNGVSRVGLSRHACIRCPTATRCCTWVSSRLV